MLILDVYALEDDYDISTYADTIYNIDDLKSYTGYWAKFQVVNSSNNVKYYYIQSKSVDTYNSVYAYDFYLVDDVYLNIRLVDDADNQIVFNTWNLYTSEDDINYSFTNSFTSTSVDTSSLLNLENCKVYLNDFNAIKNCTRCYYPSLFISGEYSGPVEEEADDGGIFAGLNNIKEKLSSLVSSVANVVSSISEGFKNVVSSIKDSLLNVVDSLTAGFDNLKEKLFNIVSSITEGFLNVVDSLVEGFKNIVNSLLEIPSRIAEKFKEIFVYLFIPSENPFDNLNSLLKEKFKIIDDIKAIIDKFKLSNSSTLTLSFKMFNKECKILDLSLVDSDLLKFTRLFIVAIFYIKFILELFKKIPAIVQGGVS